METPIKLWIYMDLRFFAENEKVESMKNGKNVDPTHSEWESKVEGLDQSGWGYQPNIVVKKQYQVSNTLGGKVACLNSRETTFLELSLCFLDRAK